MTLEKIINKIKDAGKTAIKFCKDNAKYAILTAGLIAGGYGEARAGSLKITNSSVALGGDNCYTFNKHYLNGKEGLDGDDSSYSNSFAQLQIYTHNNLIPIGDPIGSLYRDSRSLNSITPFEIKLKTNNYIENADNSLKFQVGNGDGALDHRFVIAYDISKDINDINNIHEIPNDGLPHTINLSKLVNQPAGIYANWRVEMPRIVEGDINEDGKCDFKDYAILANEWKQTSSPTTNGGNYLVSDLNLDRVTDEKDLAILVGSWLETE